MKVILLDHIHNVGQKGDIKEVSDGYFLNFLAPRKLARPASNTQMTHLHTQKAKAIEKLEALKESAEALFNKVNQKSIRLQEKASERGKLYASVSPKEIAATLKEQLKVEIPEENIETPESIKTTGDFKVSVKLYKDLKADLFIHVSAA